MKVPGTALTSETAGSSASRRGSLHNASASNAATGRITTRRKGNRLGRAVGVFKLWLRAKADGQILSRRNYANTVLGGLLGAGLAAARELGGDALQELLRPARAQLRDDQEPAAEGEEGGERREPEKAREERPGEHDERAQSRRDEHRDGRQVDAVGLALDVEDEAAAVALGRDRDRAAHQAAPQTGDDRELQAIAVALRFEL